MASIVVGLTGGIASGKSVAAEILRGLGGEIIDADIVSRQVGQEEIMTAFPQCVQNGVLNRKLLRQIVFSDEQKLKLLNSITHPLIVERILLLASQSKGVAIIVAPLLFETGLHKHCNKVINITASEQTRIQRIIKRDNIDKDLAYNIIEAQASEELRCKMSDTVITNDGNEQDLEKKLVEWWKLNIE